MRNHWHEQIQRYVNGQSSVTEATALQAALSENVKLRSLYIDYMNLDVALRAAAEIEAVAASGTGPIAIFPRHPAWFSPYPWRWLAAAAACVALVMWTALPKHRDSSPQQVDLPATISSTQKAIARLSVEPSASFPEWMSPTASLLEQSQTPK